jgi:hypothetical protein
MRDLYRNGPRFETELRDHTGKPFMTSLRCPMSWSQGQSDCSALCAWYDESEEDVGDEKEIHVWCKSRLGGVLIGRLLKDKKIRG